MFAGRLLGGPLGNCFGDSSGDPKSCPPQRIKAKVPKSTEKLIYCKVGDPILRSYLQPEKCGECGNSTVPDLSHHQQTKPASTKSLHHFSAIRVCGRLKPSALVSPGRIMEVRAIVPHLGRASHCGLQLMGALCSSCCGGSSKEEGEEGERAPLLNSGDAP